MPDRVATIASGAVRKMLFAIREAGGDARAIASQLGLDADVVEDVDGRIPIAALHALWGSALSVMPNAGEAVLGAERYAPGDYGLVGFVAMNSATFGEALRHVVRYVALWTDDPGMELHDDGTLGIAYRSAFADSPGLRAATEAAPAEILHGARLVTQRRLTPREVRFTHPPPDDVRAYEAFFGCAVRFGAGDIAVAFDPADFDLPLPKADAQLGAYLRNLANDALAKRVSAKASPHDRIREILAEELQKGVPSLEVVARRLSTSERTLRRRLEESGSSFRALLDETRAELAQGYVENEALPLTEVAFLLGFSEPSAFHRAFKRWTDTTPSAFRARGRAR